MAQYQVATYVTVEADSPEEAAQKAYVLHNDMTPEEYRVADAAAMVQEITLTMEQKDEALERHAKGELFEYI